MQNENLENRIRKQSEQILELKRRLEEANQDLERQREKGRSEKQYTASDLANVRAELEAQFVCRPYIFRKSNCVVLLSVLRKKRLKISRDLLIRRESII